MIIGYAIKSLKPLEFKIVILRFFLKNLWANPSRVAVAILVRLKSHFHSFQLRRKLYVLPREDIHLDLNFFFTEDFRNNHCLYYDLVHTADGIVKGRYIVFSEQIHEKNVVPDWNRDYKFIDQHCVTNSYLKGHLHQHSPDLRSVWELNRLQFLVVVGLAFQAEPKEEYFIFFRTIMLDWIEKNPVCHGTNWANAMEAAIRSISIVLSMSLFRNGLRRDDFFRRKLVESVFQHGIFLFSHREIGINGIKSNHFIADMVGLLFVSVCFPKNKIAKKWQQYAIREIENAIYEQTHCDGVSFEHSIPYHRFILELFTYGYLFGERNGIKFSLKFLERLEKMFEFVRIYTRPDGTVPQIGDNDDGRVLRLSDANSNSHDHRYLLAIGGMLFKREDFMYCAGMQLSEAQLLWGHDACKNNFTPKKKISTVDSYCFTDAGIAFVRDNDNYLVMTAWHVGTRGIGNHQHNDILSFELCMGGESFIIDPGCFCYSGCPESRNLFRSTIYHNTICIDGLEINDYNKQHLFRMFEKAYPKLVEFRITETEINIIVKHHGYHRLPEPITHERKIVYKIPRKRFEITDRLYGHGQHKATILFHLDRGVQPFVEGYNVVLSKKGKKIVLDLEGTDVKFKILPGFLSRSYLDKEHSFILSGEFQFKGDTKLCYSFYQEK